jgi:LCP family protein required for cell wall assembly
VGGTTHGRRRRPKAPLWARLCVWAGAVIVILSGGSVAGSKAILYRYESNIHKADLLGGGGKSGVSGNTLTGPLNYLLLGSDARPSGDTTGRSDTIIVLHISADHQSAYLISIPRDSYVDIPHCGSATGDPCQDKLNAAYNYGGPSLTATTVSNLTGVQFNGMAIIDFSGFAAVVDALGGVDMCVDEDTPTQFPPYKTFKKGCGYHFNGSTALDYVRQRENIPDGDYGRQRHQQQLIEAIVKQAGSKGTLSDPTKLDKVIRTAGKELTVDTRGVALEDIMFTLRNIRSGDLTMLHLAEHDLYIDGTSYQQLGPEATTLWQALKSDTLDQWALSNPTLVNQSATSP